MAIADRDTIAAGPRTRVRPFTRADVDRRCPGAVEHGPVEAPYYHRDDLTGLCEPERGTES